MVRQLQGREKRGAGAAGAAGGARGDPPRLPGEDPGGEPPVCWDWHHLLPCCQHLGPAFWWHFAGRMTTWGGVVTPPPQTSQLEWEVLTSSEHIISLCSCAPYIKEGRRSVRAHICVRMPTRPTRALMHTRIHMHARTYTLIRPCTYTCTHVPMHTHTHLCTRAYTHACTHTHMHTHTCTQVHSLARTAMHTCTHTPPPHTCTHMCTRTFHRRFGKHGVRLCPGRCEHTQ